MAKLFRKVILLCPTEKVDISYRGEKITQANVIVEDLPSYGSLIEASKYKSIYKQKILSLAPTVDLFYCRVPDPFSWMPAKYTEVPTIMHFVGDTVDATKHNINFSWLKKLILITGYRFEEMLIYRSAKRSTVYTNGGHLAEKLQKRGIIATPVISSTISQNDIARESEIKTLTNDPFTLCYVGYLRYTKGLDTLIEVIRKLEQSKLNYRFNIVGDGDMKPQLEKLVNNLDLKEKIILHGHIDNRNKLLSILRSSDLFFFPSLSEGSPRVVIEAMSQGCPILSTPVGSLPSTLKKDKEILFFPFNDSSTAVKKILEAAQSLSALTQMRDKALSRVKNDFTLETFIDQITTPKT